MRFVEKDLVYHVGEFDVSKKDFSSYEGYGLSVSEHPDEWSYIARLSGDTHVLKKMGGRFVDFHELTEDDWDMVIDWGISSGYVTRDVVYVTQWYDDEWEQEFEMVSDSLQELIDEDYDEEDIETREGLFPTRRMHDRMSHEVNLASVRDYLLIMYVDDTLEDMDGVWWEDDFDVSRLSAPRGCILPRKLDDWEITTE